MAKKANIIFVFGSDADGIHSEGAALTALNQYGARMGQSYGRQGNSYGVIISNKQRLVAWRSVKEQLKILYFYIKALPTKEFHISNFGKDYVQFFDSIAELRNVIFIDDWRNKV